jgi:hypothetical protein
VFVAQNLAQACGMIVTHSTFAGARLLESIDRHQHIQFIERRIAVERYIDATERPRHIVGDVACREFAQTFPCPPSSHPTEEQDWVDVSLRMWAKSTKTHSTDQNLRCESRYNRYIFSSGKIPPASQTTAVWQMNIPARLSGDTPLVPDVFPAPTLSELIQREKKLIREQHECRYLLSQIVSGYEADWRTQAERDDLLRASKQACPSAYGRVSFYFPTLKTGRLPQPSDDSLHEWNEILLEHSKDEKTPLKEEIDFYPPSSSENNFDGRERSSDDDKVNGSEFNGLNNGGVRETTEGVPNREQWLDPRRYLFNPLGKKWSEVTDGDIADVTDRSDFAQIVGEYAIEFSNLTVKELAEQLGLKPNTLTKRISRQDLKSMFHDVDIARTAGNYFCIVTLKGENSLKMLGKADAPLAEVLSAFMDERRKSESNAVKQTRKTAKKNGVERKALKELERGTVERIRDAYDTVIGLFVPDAGISGTFFRFFGHAGLIRAIAREQHAANLHTEVAEAVEASEMAQML